MWLRVRWGFEFQTSNITRFGGKGILWILSILEGYRMTGVSTENLPHSAGMASWRWVLVNLTWSSQIQERSGSPNPALQTVSTFQPLIIKLLINC